MDGNRFATVRRRAVADQAALAIAQASSGTEVAAILADAFSRLSGQRDRLVLTALDAAEGTYDVLGGSAPIVSGVGGRIDDHPILGSIDDIASPTVIRRRDRRHRSVVEVLTVARLRAVEHVPLTDGDALIGCALLLRHSRPHRRRRIDGLLEHATSALLRLRTLEALDSATKHRDDAAATIASLTSAVRALDPVSDPADVVGHVLGFVRDIDPTVIGSVVGIVVEGVVTDVAASGTTPRQVVDSLSGTHLDGFPIGREILARSEPIVAGLEDVSLATRTKIMEPLGAQSMLAAGGREAGTVRVVLSCYRRVDAAPRPWTMAAVECLLDTAAVTLARIERRELIGAIADVIEQGVLVRSAQGSMTLVNEHARRLLGDEMDDLPYETVDGRVLEPSMLPWARASVGERVDGELLRLRSTGRIHRVSATPAATGMAVVVVADVTDEVDEKAIVTDLRQRRAQRGG